MFRLVLVAAACSFAISNALEGPFTTPNCGPPLDIDGAYPCNWVSTWSAKKGAAYHNHYCCCDSFAVLTGQTKSCCNQTSTAWTKPKFTCASPPGTKCPILEETAPFTTPILPAGAAAAEIYPASKTEILSMHNCIRQNVDPPACNGTMRDLQWHDDLAYLAEKYVATCPGLVHDATGLPNITTNGIIWDRVGQNICVANCKESWSNCILLWAAEEENFILGKGADPPKAVVGHYTQVVSERSAFVGCAMSYCPNHPDWKYHQVCNYGPPGNTGSIGMKRPYKTC